MPKRTKWKPGTWVKKKVAPYRTKNRPAPPQFSTVEEMEAWELEQRRNRGKKIAEMPTHRIASKHIAPKQEDGLERLEGLLRDLERNEGSTSQDPSPAL